MLAKVCRKLLPIFVPALALAALTSGCREDKGAPEPRADQVAARPTSTARTSVELPTRLVPSVKAAVEAPSATSSAAPRASAAPAASATVSAAVEPPAVPANLPLDCDALLTPADVKEACGVEVAPVPDQPTEDIGVERTCSRRWSNKDLGSLSFLIVRHDSAAEAKERFNETEAEFAKMNDYKRIEGLGDVARRYAKQGASGDPIYSVDAVKDRFDVLVFSPKVTVGGTAVGPVCDLDKLEKLVGKMVGRVK
jgi:hypothetical protein